MLNTHAILGKNNIKPTNLIDNGCEHYEKLCRIIAPCCGKIFTCRLCHDHDQDPDKNINLDKDHTINRYAIKWILCNICGEKQHSQQNCQDCRTLFSKYYCDICHFFDKDPLRVIHCNQCGSCRKKMLNKDNYHCVNCGCCFVINDTLEEFLKKHRCLSVKNYTCPVCIDKLTISTKNWCAMRCGHYIHNECLSELLQHNYKCPICLKSIIDMTAINESIAQDIQRMEMPECYRNMQIPIMCNECHQKSQVSFHILGFKCHGCGSYNTQRI